MYTLLILEDDKDMAEMLDHLFGSTFNVVLCVGKSTAIQQAKEYFKAGKPSFVILDLIINGEGGLDLYKWMRDSGIKTPVAFLTGCHKDSKEFLAAMKTGEPLYEKDMVSFKRLRQEILKFLSDEDSSFGNSALPQASELSG